MTETSAFELGEVIAHKVNLQGEDLRLSYYERTLEARLVADAYQLSFLQTMIQGILTHLEIPPKKGEPCQNLSPLS